MKAMRTRRRGLQGLKRQEGILAYLITGILIVTLKARPARLFPSPVLLSGVGPESLTSVTVRREKALDFSGCNSRPGTGSLHPVAIEAAAEAT